MKQHATSIQNFKAQSELSEQQKQQRELNFASEVKEKLKEIVHERQEDINMITKLFENNFKKVHSELAKLHEQVRAEGQSAEKKTREALEKMLEDKVGVDEV